MSTDPTYYHPSSCDCQGCLARDARIDAENFRENMELLGKAISLPFKPIAYILDKQEKNEKALKQKRDEIIAKNEEQLSKLHNNIAVLIDDLNDTCNSRPLAPEPPAAFAMATFAAVVSTLILAFSSYYLLCIPIIALYCIFYYYDNTQNRKEMYKKYNEDYKLFEKELEGFMSILDPKIKICVEAIAELDKWYSENDYILVNQKDRVDTAQAWPEKIELNLAGPSNEFKRWYGSKNKFSKFPKYKLKYSTLWALSGYLPAPRASNS
jgi:hypothetical protein